MDERLGWVMGAEARREEEANNAIEMAKRGPSTALARPD